MADHSELPPRTGAVLCPDWPVVAGLVEADISPTAPAVVLHARRVVATSPAARACGVRVGMRQRDAQAACPEIVLLAADTGRDTRLFELVIAAIEDLVAGIHIVRPGLCVFVAAGPVRYVGSEEALANRLTDHIGATSGREAFVGFAEGMFAAALAAARPAIVPVGGTKEFLAAVDVSVLGQPSLVSVLRRCGITTLGALAALGHRAVTSRFGVDGAVAFRLACGLQEAPVLGGSPARDIEERIELDPPASRIQHATAAIHSAAERFCGRLADRGLTCTVLRIDATTATSDVLSRAWRADTIFGFADIAARLRWQLEAWLTAPRGRPTSGIVTMSLIAEHVAPADSLQLGLWGSTGSTRSRARHSADQVQDLLGIAAVTTAVSAGGRLPHNQAQHAPWRDQAPADHNLALPWPDHIAAPITTLPSPDPVRLYDRRARPVYVTARQLMSAPPVQLVQCGYSLGIVTGWAGPWPFQEHWWDPSPNKRISGAWLQLTVATTKTSNSTIESGLLLFYRNSSWWLVGSYD